jgi:hypothetical protein
MIPAITVFEWLAESGGKVPGPVANVAGTAAISANADAADAVFADAADANVAGAYYLFDPCAARHGNEARAAVRALLGAAGVGFETGKLSGRLAECCGFGGHIFASNPAIYDEAVGARVSESELPYAVYCSNCRDAFAARGKECVHVFDILFGVGGGLRRTPSISERRQNREALKRSLSEICFGQKEEASKEDPLPCLQIDEGLEKKLERELVSVREVQGIISEAERTDRVLLGDGGRIRIAHGPAGAVTCWVVYGKDGDAFHLHNAYTHRLRAVEEA